jgi:hypothetical protein
MSDGMAPWRTLPHMFIWAAVRADEPASLEDVIFRTGWRATTILGLLPALVEGGVVVEADDGLVLGAVPFAEPETPAPDPEATARFYRALVENRKPNDEEFQGYEPPGGDEAMDLSDLPRAQRVPGGRRRRKVTMTLLPAVVARAAEYARRDGRSVSRIVEEILAGYCAAPMTWRSSDLARYNVTVRDEGEATSPAPPHGA